MEEWRQPPAHNTYAAKLIQTNIAHYLWVAILNEFLWQGLGETEDKFTMCPLINRTVTLQAIQWWTLQWCQIWDEGKYFLSRQNQKYCHDTKILPVFLLDYTTKIGKFRTENSVTTDELSSLSILKVIAYPLKLGILDES